MADEVPPEENGSEFEVVDLSSEGGSDDGDLFEYKTEPYDPEPERETVRSKLAMSLVGVLAIVILGPLAAIVFTSLDFSAFEGYLGLVLSPTFGIAGTVIGFYFGSKTNKV